MRCFKVLSKISAQKGNPDRPGRGEDSTQRRWLCRANRKAAMRVEVPYGVRA